MQKRLSQIILISIILSLHLETWGQGITTPSQNADTVGQYEKFEATFTLVNSPYSDPFDPCVVDVTATFHAPDLSTVTVPAFYYIDYDIVGQNTETYQNPGTEQWKVRFAPTQVGTYTYDITVVDAGGTTVDSGIGTFNCVAGSNPGYIRIDPCDPYFLAYDDGTTRLNIGHNNCWQEGGIYGWENAMSKMNEAGENWTRLWMSQYSGDGGVELEGLADDYTGYFSGPGNLSMQTALRLDNFIEAAEEYGVALQLVFQYHGQFSTMTNPRWDLNPYNSDNGGFLDDPAEFFTDAQAIQLTKNKYRYIIARWGYSTSILAWELFNEARYTDGWDDDPCMVIDWHDEMSTYVRSIDPFGHLITTSAHGGTEFNMIWDLDNIDLIQIHHYSGDTIDYFESATQSLAGYGKPVIIGEFGAPPADGIDNPEDDLISLSNLYRAQMYEALVLHNGIWSALHVKSSAHLWWWYNYIDPLDLYDEFTALARYAEGENLGAYNLTTAPQAISGIPTISAIPVLTDFWAESSQTSFTLSGDYFPGMENLSQWLHGSNKSDYLSNPTFNLTMATDGYLNIHVEQVSDWGNISLRVLVDENEVFSDSFTNDLIDFVISVPLSAGSQSVQVENTGEDWLQIGSYEFAPEEEALLNSIGLSSNERAYLWIYDKDSKFGLTDNGTFSGETITVNNLDDGNYLVKVYETRGNGYIIDMDDADSSGGVLTCTLPDFRKDIAVKVIENNLSDLQRYLRITEIMYYPAEPNDGGYTADQIEFIELKNVGKNALTLDNVAFTAGIEFTFPAGTTLDPCGLILIARDPCSFVLEYTDVPVDVDILGPYSGQLDHEGETLTLKDSGGDTIQSFAYSSTWFEETAGGGSSLVIIDPNYADVARWSYGENWASSPDLGGSPGEDDPGLEPPVDTDMITIDSVTLKANKDRESSKDSFSIYGSDMDLEEYDIMTAATVFIGLYNDDESYPIFSEEIDIDLFTGDNGLYRYNAKSGITSFNVDMNNDTFSIAGKNVDLSGMGSPLTVEVELGDYLGSGIAAETEEEYLETYYEGLTYPDVINGTKPIPIILLKGQANGLQLSKTPKLKQVDTKENSDSLAIQGGIAAADDSVHLTNEEVMIEWGDYSVTIPAGGLIGSNGKYKYKLKDIPSVSVQIDLVKCAFKIQIKKADIPDQGDSVDLSISWTGFDETVTATLE
ncbi:MAG: DUF5060 domain-containing protein [Sedimentisphaerales bacterium]|nr:DUF5060 domain-containing protein [Sedimentisphaerales bacterium]